MNEEKPARGKGRTNLERRIFHAQKELDTTLAGDELLGAMRQCLHNQRLSVKLCGITVESSEPVVVQYTFQLSWDETENQVTPIMLVQNDFTSFGFQRATAMECHAWRAFLHGLFGLPPERVSYPAEPGEEKLTPEKVFPDLSRSIGVRP